MRQCLEAMKLSLFFLLALSLSSCMSLHGTFASNKICNRVYIGTRADFRLILLSPILGFLDLPFSFVVDTVLLPYTIPVSIQDCSKDDDGERRKDQTGKGTTNTKQD